MPKSATHNTILLRPPPGTRFTIWGADVELEFERGREAELVAWLKNWIDQYIVPQVEMEQERIARARLKADALQKEIDDDNAKRAADEAVEKAIADRKTQF